MSEHNQLTNHALLRVDAFWGIEHVIIYKHKQEAASNGKAAAFLSPQALTSTSSLDDDISFGLAFISDVLFSEPSSTGQKSKNGKS
jgi:hypothetical protein